MDSSSFIIEKSELLPDSLIRGLGSGRFRSSLS